MSIEQARRAAAAVDRAMLPELEALPPEAWDRPSDCEGWTIKSVLVHLIQVADLFIDGATRGLGGDAGPPPLVAAEGIPAWRAWRASRLEEALARPPSELLADYRARRADMERLLWEAERAGPDVQAWHPVGARSVAWWADQWLFELALHDWDMRAAADPAADLRAACLPAFARALPARLGRGFGAAADPALAGRYRVELGGDSPFSWLVRVADGQVESPSPDDGPADATIHSDPAAFALVMTNRRPVDQFAAADRWRAEGDTTRAEAFGQAFQSY